MSARRGQRRIRLKRHRDEDGSGAMTALVYDREVDSGALRDRRDDETRRLCPPSSAPRPRNAAKFAESLRDMCPFVYNLLVEPPPGAILGPSARAFISPRWRHLVKVH